MIATSTAPIAGLIPDAAQIERFASALFRYAESGTFVALRAFYDDRSGVFATEAHQLTDDDDAMPSAAVALATRCAAAGAATVFAPPIATFSGGTKADEAALANGLALSVECDQQPTAARAKLEGLLGPATMVVASGGAWTDPETGEVQDKLHLHWRLDEPTSDAGSHADLKRARALATKLVGGDASNKPIVHPIRWPGSWHRKGKPVLAQIVAEHDRELSLPAALERLEDATAAAGVSTPTTHAPAAPNASGVATDGTDDLVRDILTGADYHGPLTKLAHRYIAAGMNGGQVVLTLRGLMSAVPEPVRDIKGSTIEPGRWQSRFGDIPRAVSTAQAKLNTSDAHQSAGPVAASMEAPDAQVVAPFFRDEDDPYAGRRWLIYQMLPEVGVALLSGQSRTGKTFAALDLALSLTLGEPFAGRETDRPGGVLYLAAEGAAEIPTRWKAAKEARGVEGERLPFRWTDRLPCKLLDRGAEERFVDLATKAAADMAADGAELAAVFVDTVAVAAGWTDEQSNAEAQRAMDVLHAISRATGALVVAIDHHGKDAERGTRGASSKGANADATLALLGSADENGIFSNRRLVIQKCRGGPEGDIFHFGLEARTIGEDERGRPVTTCTVNWSGQSQANADRLPPTAAKVIEILQEMSAHIEPDEYGRRVVAEATWKDACEDRRISASDSSKSRTQAFRRALTELRQRKLIVDVGGAVWLTSGGASNASEGFNEAFEDMATASKASTHYSVEALKPSTPRPSMLAPIVVNKVVIDLPAIIAADRARRSNTPSRYGQ